MSFLKNTGINKLIILGFGIIMSLGAGTMLAGLGGIHAISSSMQNMGVETLKSDAAVDLRFNVDQLILGIGSLIMESDPGKRTSHLETIKNHRTAYLNALEILKEKASTEKDREDIAAIEDSVQQGKVGTAKAIELAVQGRQAEAMLQYSTICREDLIHLKQVIDNALKRRRLQVDQIKTQTGKTVTSMFILLITAGVVAGILSLFVLIFILRFITVPLRSVTHHLDEIGKGDFSQEISREALNRGDEFGVIARAIHGLNTNVGQMIKRLAEGIQTLAASSSQLSGVANEVSQGSREGTQKSETVAAAAEEMSTGMVSVAAGMEHASSSLSSVASSTEEMTSTISEIATNSEKANAITAQAVTHTGKILEMVSELGKAAQEIGKVTETITTISSQTNLLALNATIEAARAGAAGKGFAVVAGEIKELAQQTAQATEDIHGKIMAIQNSTSGTIEDIEEISKVIGEVSEIVTSITAAIHEQSAVTRDIAQNISQATGGVAEVNERVAQSTGVVREIARDIAGVNTSAKHMMGASSQVQSSAADLTVLAGELKQLVEKFKV